MANGIAEIYLPTLEELTNNARYRQSAAILAAQAYGLRTALGWHLGTDALAYAQQTEKYATIANDATLKVHAMRRVSVTLMYGGQHEAALHKAEEARYFMEHTAVPSPIKCRIYLDLAIYQARCGRIADAKRSLKLFNKFRSTFQGQEGNVVLTTEYHGEYGLLCLEGEALALRGEHDTALDLYGQIAKDPSNRPKSERGRIEFLIHQLQSLLAQPSPDKEECIKLWVNAISSAQAIESEQRLAETLLLLDTMEKLWPREDDVADLQAIATHW